MINPYHGTPFSKTATNATSAVATQTGVAGTQYFITDVGASSDKAGSILLIKDGSTTIWQQQVGAGSIVLNFSTPLSITTGNDCSITIDGTAACKSNMSGLSITVA